METRKQPRSRRKPKATTKDVVGNLAMDPQLKGRWHRQYERLLDLREFLVRERGDLAKDALEEQPSYSMHMADAGTDTYDRDFALGMLSSEQDAVYEIDQALERIREGTYGICDATGKPIEPERLEAIPWTRFSAAAEKQLEREGRIKSARLGPRESVKAGRERESREPE